jgi:hypothetical protein
MNLMGTSMCTPRPKADVAQITEINPSWKLDKTESLSVLLEKTAAGILWLFKASAAVTQFSCVKQKQTLLGKTQSLQSFTNCFNIEAIRWTD